MFRIHSVLKNFKNFEQLKKQPFELNSNHKGLFFGQTTPINSHRTLLNNLWSITTGNRSSKRYFSEEKKVQPPIGVSDFRKLVEYKNPQGEPYLFVDKSLWVKDIIDDPSEVILITRPRRFGKTLNMSLLQHFFAKEVDNQMTEALFKNLKIIQYPDYMKYQGQYPVISLTFKDIKSRSFEAAYDDFGRLISRAYEKHEQILSSQSKLTDRQKRQYELILNRKAPDTDIRGSLQSLTFYLHQYYGVKPIVLIDEYDTPIQTAYLESYYKEMVTFMREFMGAGLKDNSHLHKAVLTGILRVSKESLFSGLNNLKVYSLLNSRHGEYFGFTEEEVRELLEKANLGASINDVRTWYNGYQAGNVVIYNPWSIVNCIQEQGKLSPYWVNTSDNALIKDLIIKSSTHTKAQFESLLQGKVVEKFINENVVFDHLESNESTLWTLLLMSGYLKVTSTKEAEQGSLCQLEIPNKEVRDLYRMFIAEWLSGVNDATIFNSFLADLLNGKMEDFQERLSNLMLQTFSVHDIKGNNPEKFFHGFMLGLIAGIDQKHYRIDSNKESGLGRYDIMIAPNDSKKLGIILEIKSLDQDSHQSLKEAAENALKQIDKKKYSQSTLFQHVNQCLKVGVAFRGKELETSFSQETLNTGINARIVKKDLK